MHRDKRKICSLSMLCVLLWKTQPHTLDGAVSVHFQRTLKLDFASSSSQSEDPLVKWTGVPDVCDHSHYMYPK